jgi:hypothetical protein
MSKYIKLFGVPLAAVLVAYFLMPDAIDTFAQSLGADSGRIDAIQTATGGSGSLIGLLQTLINYFLGFLGILSVAMIIYGGFQYVTAGVNEQGAETGKKILIYAAIGVIVILLSFVIVNALLNSAGTGGDPTVVN